MKSVLILFLFVTTLTLNAQSRYVPGFIVKNSNDTIKGFVYNKSLKSGSTFCKFKNSIDSPSQRFLPFEIMSYGTGGTLIESRKEYDRKEKKTKKSEFYKVIFDGKLDILNENANRFYVGTDTSRFIYYLNRKDFLYYLTSDQPELQPHIKELKFTESRFVDLLTRYQNSLNLPDYKIYLPQRTIANLDFFLLGGYNLSSLDTPSETGEPLKYNKSYAPLFGYGVDYFPSIRGIDGSFSINFQNRFTKELFQYQSVAKYSNSSIYTDIVFEAFVIQLPIGLKFHKMLNKDLKFYGMPGLSWQKMIPKESRIITDFVSTNEATTSFTDIDYYMKSKMSLFLSVGLEKKVAKNNKIFVDLYTDYVSNFSFHRYSVSLSVGYKILNIKFDD